MLVGMGHPIHDRVAADLVGWDQRVYGGNGDAFTCNENAGRILGRESRAERCAQTQASSKLISSIEAIWRKSTEWR